MPSESVPSESVSSESANWRVAPACPETPSACEWQYQCDTRCALPRKLRELIADLKHAGFVQEPARGSHRKFRHPKGVTAVLSGHGEGTDALPYQERQVRRLIEESRR